MSFIASADACFQNSARYQHLFSTLYYSTLLKLVAFFQVLEKACRTEFMLLYSDRPDQMYLQSGTCRNHRKYFVVAVDHTVDHNRFAKCDRFFNSRCDFFFFRYTDAFCTKCFCHFHKIHTHHSEWSVNNVFRKTVSATGEPYRAHGY